MSTQSTLDRLAQELSKVPRHSAPWIEKAVQYLIDTGEYPASTAPGNTLTVLEMVYTYGPNWHRWSAPVTCECGGDLRDYNLGPPFKVTISVEDDEGHVSHSCPLCP